MKYIIKYERPILAFTLLWVMCNIYFANHQNKFVAAYLSVSVYIAVFFLLIFAYGRNEKIPVAKTLLPLAFLMMLVQLIGLIKIYETPAYLANMIPPWFPSYTSIIALVVNSIIYLLFQSLAKREK